MVTGGGKESDSKFARCSSLWSHAKHVVKAYKYVSEMYCIACRPILRPKMMGMQFRDLECSAKKAAFCRWLNIFFTSPCWQHSIFIPFLRIIFVLHPFMGHRERGNDLAVPLYSTEKSYTANVMIYKAKILVNIVYIHDWSAEQSLK